MAELRFYDYGKTFQDAEDRGFQRGQQNRLQGLMQQAWNAPPEQQQSQLAQIAGINPQAAMGLEKRAMDRREQMQTDAVNLARAWKSSANATPEQRQAFFESFIRPQAQRRGLPLPQTYDPAAFDREADGLIAMSGSGTAGGVHSAFRGRNGNMWVLGRDGQVRDTGAPFDPNNQIIDTGNGFFGVNKTNLSAAPVTVGAPPQQAPQGLSPGTYQTPAGIVRVGDVAPEDQEAMLADIQRGAQGGDMRLPERDVSPAQFGQQLRSAPKPADAPSGYRYGADGKTLEPIPGGPQDPGAQGPDAKDEQALRKEVSDLVKQDRSILGMYQNVISAAQNPSAAGDLSMIFAYMKMLDPGSVVREQEFANAQNAAGVPDQVRNAWNRALSGQRLNPQQRGDFVNQARQLANAAQQRITSTARNYQGISDQYGFDPQRATGLADFRGVQSSVQSGPAQGGEGYQVGQIIEAGGKRYRVTGGDPNDPDVEEVR